MAQPTTIRGGKVVVQLDLAETGTYTAPCGFNSKSLNLEKALTDTTLSDCSDPDAVGWIVRDAESFSASISGEGVLAEESVQTWLQAFYTPGSVRVKVIVTFPSTTVTFTGLMHVSSFAFDAPQSGRVAATVEMQSDGMLAKAVA